DVDLHGVVEKPVDEDRAVRAHLGGAVDVGAERVLVVDDLHAASPEDVGGADEYRVPDAGRDLGGLVGRHRGTERGSREAGPGEHVAELAAVLREGDGGRARPDHRDPGLVQLRRDAGRGRAPSWTRTPATVPEPHSAW